MTVLHVSGARSWGGNEQQLMYLLDELPGFKVNQKLFCFENTRLEAEATKKDVEILSMPYCKPYSSEYRNRLNQIVQEHSIDIIHLHTSDAVTGYVVTDLLKNLKTRTLFARKGIRGKKTSLLSKYKYNYRNIDTILCISEYVKTHFGKILTERNKEKLVVVYNGIKVQDSRPQPDFQLREKYGISNEFFLLGSIANHTAAKDLGVLIETMNKIVHEHGIKDIRLIQMGDFSKLTPGFKSLIAEKKLEEYIIMTDFQKNAFSFLPQFDTFVVTSEREGGPSSLVEALYYKAPIVSTRVGVVDEVIEDGVNGFSVPIKNPGSLAEKILEIKSRPELKKQFTDRSYEIFLQKFTAKRYGEATFAVYENMMQKELHR